MLVLVIDVNLLFVVVVVCCGNSNRQTKSRVIVGRGAPTGH